VERGETRINKFYVALAVLVLTLLIFTFLFGGNEINRAIVDSEYLTDGWADLGDSTYVDRLLGLEKQASIKYGIEDDPDNSAFLTVTTIKTLFMMSEDELIEKTEETIIESAEDQNITLDESSRLKSSRVLNNSHKTYYVLYNGSIISNNVSEEIVIIGEAWNCARSGASIICIGYAQITDNANDLGYNYASLIKILGDEEGTFVGRFNSFDFITEKALIFNVRCH